jgi:hypothetical protein
MATDYLQDPMRIPIKERPVQTEFPVQRRNDLRRGVVTRECDRRPSWKEIQHPEGKKGDADQHWNSLKKPRKSEPQGMAGYYARQQR